MTKRRESEAPAGESRKDHAYWSGRAKTLDELVSSCRVALAAGGTVSGEVGTAYFTAVQLGWKGHMGEWVRHVREESE